MGSGVGEGRGREEREREKIEMLAGRMRMDRWMKGMLGRKE